MCGKRARGRNVGMFDADPDLIGLLARMRLDS
jgi:hypothetical protein